MAEDTKVTESKKDEAPVEEKKDTASDKPKRAPRPRKVTIRGRVNTTALEAGREVEVERTDTIGRLIANGFVEEV